MIKKNRIVYYCDFCKKKLMRVDAMIQHEEHCTANLDRKCGVCEDDNILPNYRKILEELKARYKIYESQTDYSFMDYSIKWIGEKITRDTLAKLVDNCPACMLTLWRAIDDIAKPEDFNYKKEMESWWEEVNISKREMNYYTE